MKPKTKPRKRIYEDEPNDQDGDVLIAKPAMPRKRLDHGESDDDPDKARKRKTINDNIAAAQVERLLYTRSQTAQALGTSVVTVTRMEQRGLLPPIRLNSSPKSMVFYRAEDVRKLAQTGVGDA